MSEAEATAAVPAEIPPRRRRAVLAGLAGAALVVGLLGVGWVALPALAPRLVMRHSPWLGPVLRAAAHATPRPLEPRGLEVDWDLDVISRPMPYVQHLVEDRFSDDAVFRPEAVAVHLDTTDVHRKRVILALLVDLTEDGWLVEAETFARALDDPDERVRQLAVEGLHRCERRTLLGPALEDASPRVRADAFAAIAWQLEWREVVSDEPLLPLVVVALDSELPDVRARAAELVSMAMDMPDAILDRELPRLRARLVEHADRDVRHAILRAFHQLEDPNALLTPAVLARLTSDDDLRVRETALECAYNEIPTDAWTALADDPDADDRTRRSAALLAALTEDDVPRRALDEALASDAAWSRILALAVLAESGAPIDDTDEASSTSLAQLHLEDPSPAVRAAAVAVIASWADDDAIAALPLPRLLALATDESDDVRSQAGFLLARRADADVPNDGVERAIAALVADPSAWVRRSALDAIIQGPALGAEVVAAVGTALEGDDVELVDQAIAAARACRDASLTEPLAALLADADLDRVRDLGETLAWIPGERAAALLEELLEHEDEWVRADVARAIGSARRSELAPAVRQVARGDEVIPRAYAVRALVELRDPEALALVEELVAHEVSDLRRVGIDGLIELHPEGFRDRLAALARDDPDDDVRRQAARTLERLPR